MFAYCGADDSTEAEIRVCSCQILVDNFSSSSDIRNQSGGSSQGWLEGRQFLEGVETWLSVAGRKYLLTVARMIQRRLRSVFVPVTFWWTISLRQVAFLMNGLAFGVVKILILQDSV
ncbi:hypothetical protein CDAR_187461 [Caerostris darwini]|uniref:Uncharacterized protein n=1 Tax=Caerostris darwini TaxID=1538125 RepID=A0AAV4R3Q5_9ARAC|nr:hypothetical protein CDAR_187461 [Caerostris darwini]